MERSDSDEKREGGTTDSSAATTPSKKRPRHSQPERSHRPSAELSSRRTKSRNPPTDKNHIAQQEQVEELDRTQGAVQNKKKLTFLSAPKTSDLRPLGNADNSRSISQLASITSTSESETNVSTRREGGDDSGDADSTQESRTALHHRQQPNQPQNNAEVSLLVGLIAEHLVTQEGIRVRGTQNQLNNGIAQLLAALTHHVELTAVQNTSRSLYSEIRIALLQQALQQGAPDLANNAPSGLAAGLFGGLQQMQIPRAQPATDERNRLSTLLQRQIYLQQMSAQHDQRIQYLASQLPSSAAATALSLPNQLRGPQLAISTQDRCESMPSFSTDVTAALSSSVASTSSRNASRHATSTSHVDFAPTGRSPILLATDADSSNLSPYQCLARQQIELFETVEEDVLAKAQGRNIPIRIGQVGIRCRHCSSLPRSRRAEGGAVFYSKTINGIYQVSLNMSRLHFLSNCTMIPDNVKKSLAELKVLPRRLNKGRQFWNDSLVAQGVIEEDDFLRFK